MDPHGQGLSDPATSEPGLDQRTRGIAEGLPNPEFIEVNAVEHADLPTSRPPEAMGRIRALCEELGANPDPL